MSWCSLQSSDAASSLTPTPFPHSDAPPAAGPTIVAAALTARQRHQQDDAEAEARILAELQAERYRNAGADDGVAAIGTAASKKSALAQVHPPLPCGVCPHHAV